MLQIEGYTTRNRGTEFIKSPEMLTVAYASQKTRDAYDRRKKVGSNSASDVWSIGISVRSQIGCSYLHYYHRMFTVRAYNGRVLIL